MRALLIFILGLLLGAALFHVHYRSLTPAARCAWDHPFDDSGRDRCVTAASSAGYGAGARRQLDNLVDKVGG